MRLKLETDIETRAAGPTEVAEKKHGVYASSHSVPQAEVVRETLAWFDKYLGPTQPRLRDPAIERDQARSPDLQ